VDRAGDSGNRLIWFVDLYRFLAREAAALAAARLWQQAEAWNAAAEVCEVLALLQRFLPSAAGAALLAAAARGEARSAAVRNPAADGAAGLETTGAFLRWAMRVHPVLAPAAGAPAGNWRGCCSVTGAVTPLLRRDIAAGPARVPRPASLSTWSADSSAARSPFRGGGPRRRSRRRWRRCRGRRRSSNGQTLGA